MVVQSVSADLLHYLVFLSVFKLPVLLQGLKAIHEAELVFPSLLRVKIPTFMKPPCLLSLLLQYLY